MKRHMILWLSALALAACATGQVAELENERPLSEKEVAERLSALSKGDRKMLPTAAERFDIAIVGGSCAPKPSAKFAVTSCVNDKPCNGHGLRMTDGSIVCACYETRGGCGEGQFCHARTFSCTKAPADLYHTQ